MKGMSKGDSFVLLMIGLIMGTIFTFGMQYWNAPVEKSDTSEITAKYLSHKKHYGGNQNPKVIYVYFENLEVMTIDGECINEKLMINLDAIESETEMVLRLHPNANTILDMRTKDIIILEFDETVNKLVDESKGFMWLGVVCYLFGLFGLIEFVRRQ